MNEIKRRTGGLEVTKILIILNVLAFLYSVWLSRSINISSLVLIQLGGNFRPLVEQGEYWRFFTAMFLHGDGIHLMFNMYSLRVLGNTMEKILPKWKYLVLYFVSGLGASLLSSLMQDNVVSIGASGAIFGLLGGLMGYVITHRDMFQKGALNNLVLIVIINLALGFQPGSGIDNFGHLGGVASGFLLSFLIKPDRR